MYNSVVQNTVVFQVSAYVIQRSLSNASIFLVDIAFLVDHLDQVMCIWINIF